MGEENIDGRQTEEVQLREAVKNHLEQIYFIHRTRIEHLIGQAYVIHSRAETINAIISTLTYLHPSFHSNAHGSHDNSDVLETSISFNNAIRSNQNHLSEVNAPISYSSADINYHKYKPSTLSPEFKPYVADSRKLCEAPSDDLVHSTSLEKPLIGNSLDPCDFLFQKSASLEKSDYFQNYSTPLPNATTPAIAQTTSFWEAEKSTYNMVKPERLCISCCDDGNPIIKKLNEKTRKVPKVSTKPEMTKIAEQANQLTENIQEKNKTYSFASEEESDTGSTSSDLREDMKKLFPLSRHSEFSDFVSHPQSIKSSLNHTEFSLTTANDVRENNLNQKSITNLILDDSETKPCFESNVLHEERPHHAVACDRSKRIRLESYEKDHLILDSHFTRANHFPISDKNNLCQLQIGTPPLFWEIGFPTDIENSVLE